MAKPSTVNSSPFHHLMHSHGDSDAGGLSSGEKVPDSKPGVWKGCLIDAYVVGSGTGAACGGDMAGCHMA